MSVHDPQLSRATRLPRSPASASRARRFVGGVLERWQVPQDVSEVATLLVSELAGNAVRHGSGEFDVSVSRSAHTIRVSVHDSSPTAPTRKAVSVDAEGGRGIWLVEALAGRWGTEVQPGGKDVWFELSCPEPCSA